MASLVAWTGVFVNQIYFFADTVSNENLTKFVTACKFASIGPLVNYPTILGIYIYSLFNDDLTADGSGVSQISFNEAYLTMIVYLFFMATSSLYQYTYLPKVVRYWQLETFGLTL